jgi:hypothetical protein
LKRILAKLIVQVKKYMVTLCVFAIKTALNGQFKKYYFQVRTPATGSATEIRVAKEEI